MTGVLYIIPYISMCVCVCVSLICIFIALCPLPFTVRACVCVCVSINLARPKPNPHANTFPPQELGLAMLGSCQEFQAVSGCGISCRVSNVEQLLAAPEAVAHLQGAADDQSPLTPNHQSPLTPDHQPHTPGRGGGGGCVCACVYAYCVL